MAEGHWMKLRSRAVYEWIRKIAKDKRTKMLVLSQFSLVDGPKRAQVPARDKPLQLSHANEILNLLKGKRNRPERKS